MTVAANLFLLCVFLAFINKPPNTTNNITRISTVMTNSTSMTKAAVGGATKCIRDTRRSKYAHPQMTQMIQLRDLEQPIPGEHPLPSTSAHKSANNPAPVHCYHPDNQL